MYNIWKDQISKPFIKSLFSPSGATEKLWLWACFTSEEKTSSVFAMRQSVFAMRPGPVPSFDSPRLAPSEETYPANTKLKFLFFSALPIFPLVFAPELGAANVTHQDQGPSGRSKAFHMVYFSKWETQSKIWKIKWRTSQLLQYMNNGPATDSCSKFKTARYLSPPCGWLWKGKSVWKLSVNLTLCHWTVPRWVGRGHLLVKSLQSLMSLYACNFLLCVQWKLPVLQNSTRRMEGTYVQKKKKNWSFVLFTTTGLCWSSVEFSPPVKRLCIVDVDWTIQSHDLLNRWTNASSVVIG